MQPQPSLLVPGDVEADLILPYILDQFIGKGGFGSVYRGLDMEKGEIIAMKVIQTPRLNAEQLDSIKSEINFLKRLHHPNIVRYVSAFTSKTHVYIAMEYLGGGSLARCSHLMYPLRENVCSKFIFQVLQGLDYLHKQGVIHRDIKGANILLSTDSVPKLSDFGVATSLNEVNTNAVVGTPYWMAPEVIQMSSNNSACDIWSLGSTIIECLTSKPPYSDVHPLAALYRIVQDEHPPIPDNLSVNCVDFLRLCFKKDPNARATTDQLLQHPWVNEADPKIVHPKAAPVRKPASKKSAVAARKISYRLFNPYQESKDEDYDSELPMDIDLSGPIVLQDDPDRLDDLDAITFDSIDSEPSQELEEMTKIEAEVQTLTSRLEGSHASSEIEQTCYRLIDLLLWHPLLKSSFLTASSLSNILKLLSQPDNGVRESILHLLYDVSKGEQKNVEALLLTGFYSSLMHYCKPSLPTAIRRYSALFIRELFNDQYVQLIKSFITCGGLPALVSLLEGKIDEAEEIHLIALEGVTRVLDVSELRSFWFLMFGNYRLLETISDLVLQHITSQSPHSQVVLRALTVFSLFSIGDKNVQSFLCNPAILKPLFMPEMLSRTSSAERSAREAPILKILKSLTMIQKTHDLLQEAGALDFLIQYLRPSYVSSSITSSVVQALYYLCTYNQARLIQLIHSNVISFLVKYIQEQRLCNGFAFNILFSLSVYPHGVLDNVDSSQIQTLLQLFINTLGDSALHTHAIMAFKSFFVCLPEASRDRIITEENIALILQFFARDTIFSDGEMVQSLATVLSNSKRLLSTVRQSRLFLWTLVDRIRAALKSSESSSQLHARCLMGNMRLLQLVYFSLDSDRERWDFAVDYSILPELKIQAGEDEEIVYVKESAKSISADIVRVGAVVMGLT